MKYDFACRQIALCRPSFCGVPFLRSVLSGQRTGLTFRVPFPCLKFRRTFDPLVTGNLGNRNRPETEAIPVGERRSFYRSDPSRAIYNVSENRDRTYLPGVEVNRDQRGGSSRMRFDPLHFGLIDSCDFPHVDSSGAEFLIVGDSVRAVPCNTTIHQRSALPVAKPRLTHPRWRSANTTYS